MLGQDFDNDRGCGKGGIFGLCRAFGAVELPERYISANLMEVADGFIVFATRFSTVRVEG